MRARARLFPFAFPRRSLSRARVAPRCSYILSDSIQDESDAPDATEATVATERVRGEDEDEMM